MPEVTLRGALPPLLLPPLLLVLVALAGAALVPFRRRAGMLLTVAAALGLLALATPMAAGYLRASLERGMAASPQSAAVPGAIIILGADVVRGSDGPDVGPLTLERLRAGAALHRTTGLPLLVTGGPAAPGEPPLAALMARSLAADFGVPVRWTEIAARTTGENATLSVALLAGTGIGAAHVVTHGWHQARALEEFRHAGLVVFPAPVRLHGPPRGTASDFLPRADRLAESWWMIREWAGRLVRRLGG